MHDTEIGRRAAVNVLSNYLCLSPGQRLWCFTDDGRKWLADLFAASARELGLVATAIDLSPSAADKRTPESVSALLGSLSDSDAVISLLSHGAVAAQYFGVFPSFRPPEGFPGRSAVIRQHYPDDALLAHLLTAPVSAEAAAQRALAHDGVGQVHITTRSGTDVCCELKAAQVLPYKLDGDRRHIYLPPAEVAYGIVPGSAAGVIVADITVGEFVVRDEPYDVLGLVDAPVEIAVTGGRVTRVRGGDVAKRLAACFERLDREQPTGSDCRAVVELGFGLSVGTPVGLGAPDECLQGTCHFGIGNDFFFGGKNAVPMHIDVIAQGPVLQSVSR